MMELWCAPLPDKPPAPESLELPADLLERKRSDRHSRHTHASLAGYALLRKALQSHNAGWSLRRLRLTTWGKPYLPNGPCFSLSHSGGYVMCALGRDELGLDTELVRPRPLRLPEAIFSPAERHYVDAAADPLAAFYWLWTRKEAVAKADGRGFSSLFPDEKPGRSRVELAGNVWFLHRVRVETGYETHIASGRANEPILLRRTCLD